MVSKSKVIMHLDMDAFFVNCELLENPSLEGKEIIVAHESHRSVVLSASYEARKFGVRSAMPLSRAKNLCPQAIVVQPSQNYREYSRRIMGILREITDAVEQVSVDEAFVDLTGAMRRLGDPVSITQNVRQRIQKELGLPCSAGISSSKFMAKMASTASKPNGLWVVPPARVQEFLDPLPVSSLWGVGPKSTQVLKSWGIQTVYELREISQTALVAKFGSSQGNHLWSLSRGIDNREVIPHHREKSIGAEHTFEFDTDDPIKVDTALYRMCLKVAQRMRGAGRQTKTLSLKVRFSDFQTLTRSCLLPEASNTALIYHEAIKCKLRDLQIIGEDGALTRQIRLVGIRAEKLDNSEAGVQSSLFEMESGLGSQYVAQSLRWAEVEQTMDQIHSRFGEVGLLPAKYLEGYS